MAHSEFYKALSTTLYLGAARHDASPAQLVQLRESLELIKSLIEVGEYAQVRLLVREIMGDGWVPGPDWRLKDE